MSGQATFQRLDAPSVLLIGLDGSLESYCMSTLLDSGLRILKVRQLAPGLERVAVTMPKLVVAQSTLGNKDAQALVDRCVAVGAKMLWLDPDEEQDIVRQKLLGAAMDILGKMFG